MKIYLINPPYGYDAPEMIKKFGCYGVLTLLVTVILIIFLPTGWVSFIATSFMLGITIFLLFPAITILAGSLYFKFRERDWLFSHIPLKGNENVLDVGCGRGLLLIDAAKRLTTGKAYGLDLWVQADQSRNSKEATLTNAQIENVYDKVEIHSGVINRRLPNRSTLSKLLKTWICKKSSYSCCNGGSDR